MPKSATKKANASAYTLEPYGTMQTVVFVVKASSRQGAERLQKAMKSFADFIATYDAEPAKPFILNDVGEEWIIEAMIDYYTGARTDEQREVLNSAARGALKARDD